MFNRRLFFALVALVGLGCSGEAIEAPGSGGFGGGAGAGGNDGCLAEELCDGIDNDCDGTVDEACACVSGDQQACYSGPNGTDGLGACVAGQQSCDETGTWSGCVGEVVPATESCDGADDDCDGAVDEGFGSVTCGLGVCQITVEECTEGQPNPCIPGPPSPNGESCDGTDDDCDGSVDEGCSCIDGTTQPCYSGARGTVDVGECASGSQTCANGAWGACTGDVTPAAEQCDGLDNDCDAETDEGDPGGGSACGTGQSGVCAAGVEHCLGGQLSCQAVATPSAEQCNGLDDDCDGQADEQNPGGGGLCSTGQLGACAVGTLECTGGMLECEPNTSPTGEQCDQIDNDCDGMSDEGNPQGGGNCNSGQPGVCAAGTLQCQLGSLDCIANQSPGAEQCDGLDNDCDSAVDEGDPGGGNACATGLSGVCAAGTQHCVGGQLACQQNTAPSAEQCDGLDNDCDGQADEGNPGSGTSCSTGQPGVCAAGTTQCQSGMLACQQSAVSSAEQCDSLDNDCDGQSDEGNPGAGASCSTGQAGICGAGTTQCQGGSLACQPNSAPQVEICGDSLDNDCDGQTDEACNDCTTNLAASASPSFSGGGGVGYGPSNFNDGTTEAMCASTCGANCFAWISNGTAADGEWIQYQWPSPVTIGSMFIDAKTCTGSCTSAGGRTMFGGTVQWWNGSSWVTLQSFANNNGDRAFNFPAKATTTRIRVFNIRAGTCQQASNTEIFEWYVWGGNNCQP